MTNLRNALVEMAIVTAMAVTLLATPAHASCENQCGVTPGSNLHSSGQGNAGALMRAIENNYPRTQYFDVRTSGFAGVVNVVSGWLASWGFYERSNTIYSRYNASRGAVSTNDNRGYGGWSWAIEPKLPFWMEDPTL